MEYSEQKNSRIIDGLTLCISLALLCASAVGSVCAGSGSTLPAEFLRILTSPGPLVTDYFGVGSMPATFLNAGLCAELIENRADYTAMVELRRKVKEDEDESSLNEIMDMFDEFIFRGNRIIYSAIGKLS